MRRALVLLLLAIAGCTGTGVTDISLWLETGGTRIAAPVEVDGWRVTLERADLAFGPLYLCSSTKAGHNCDTARAEWTGTAVVSALEPRTRPAGILQGTKGTVRSWMFDLGIVSLLTHDEPVPLAAAVTLGGNSLVVSGAAERDGVVVRFEAAIPIRQGTEAERGIPVLRKSDSEPFEHELSGADRALRIRFDARAWIGGIDFNALAASCEDTGCADPLGIDPDSQGGRAIRTALEAGERPTFEWINEE
jgi:hypothetical protein